LTSPALRLNRDQLAKFLPDHETIVQFENLFQVADEVQNSNTDDALILAGNALAKANDTAQALLWSRVGLNLFPKDLTYKVGIGTASPSAMLDVAQDAVFNSSFGSYDFRANKLSSGSWLFYDSSTDTLDIDSSLINLTGTVKSKAITVNKTISSVTETISATSATDIYIDTPSNTLTISNMIDGSKLQFHNKSGGDANLNFSIKIGTNIISAPSIMPNGDSYELVYDSGDNQWVM
jgi:hypothetical protein